MTKASKKEIKRKLFNRMIVDVINKIGIICLAVILSGIARDVLALPTDYREAVDFLPNGEMDLSAITDDIDYSRQLVFRYADLACADIGGEVKVIEKNESQTGTKEQLINGIIGAIAKKNDIDYEKSVDYKVYLRFKCAKTD